MKRGITPYILALADPACTDRQRSGAKAAVLARLHQAGFPVPDGFVLTVEAYDRFLEANRLGQESPPEAVAAALLPDDLSEALFSAAEGLDDAPLAVRSSGLAEDLPDASFAGQYETVLDVRGNAALADAVPRCWASALSPRVAAYRAAQAKGRIGTMAVLVQRMVPADAAGVAFTANPVTGERRETVVSAVRGLGERLVSGQASPDEWLVRGNTAVCQRAPEGAIDASQARAVADLARSVARHFGSPQDIEWALADGALFLLQARPITALPEPATEMLPVPVEPPPGFWQRDVTHYPQPLSPMTSSLLIRGFAGEPIGIKHMCDEFGLLLENVEFQEIGGWVYNRAVPLGGKDRRAPPAWLMPLLIRVVPHLRARIQQCVEAIRSDKAGRFIRRWYEEWQPALAARIAELRDVELSTLSDRALDEHLGQAVDLVREGEDIHFLAGGGQIFTLTELVFTCRDLLGWDEARAFEMLNGLSAKSTEPAYQLAELARMARERPVLRSLLEHYPLPGHPDRTMERLAEIDGDFAMAFAAYEREYGCRLLRYELADLTAAETPALVLQLIRDQIVRGYDPAAEAAALEQQRAATIAEARALLADKPPAARERFERALRRAELAYPVREDAEFYTASAPLALVRYTALELGRRLAQRGALVEPDDVFFLELEEARATLRAGGERHTLVARRKAERAWVEAHPGPATYGTDPGPPPPLDALPPEARFAMEAIGWFFDRVLAPGANARQQTAGEVFHGIAASPGQYTGRVRVIMSEAEFAKLQPGDVLVCPITSPVWSVLFPSVGALVTDTGGILSHPAIIAREYRVPAVVATGNATRLLRDGQMVTVDGSAGVVEVVS